MKIALSAGMLFLGVAAGAFGSHGLQSLLTARLAEVWDTAVLYHLIHGLGLLLLAVFERQNPIRVLATAWWVMLTGVILFSGSLYGIVLGGWRWLGPVTPVGGTAMMLAWLLVAWSGLRLKP